MDRFLLHTIQNGLSLRSHLLWEQCQYILNIVVLRILLLIFIFLNFMCMGAMYVVCICVYVCMCTMCVHET